MTTAKLKVTKYRPVLTAEQITYILNLAKTEIPISTASMSLISSLAPFAAKIENAGIQAAYTTAPAPAPASSTLEKLGANIPTPSLTNQSLTKEEHWENCYLLYKTNPENCTLKEIAAAQEHAYLNDLMSTEEIAAFEANANSIDTGAL